MFGLDLDAWNAVMVSFLGIAAIAAVVVGLSTAIIIKLQKQADLESKETIAGLNNNTARLQADNLVLQTVLLPRHAGLIGLNDEPRAKTWFAGLERWAGTKLLIQVVPGDPEAQNLANEIAIIVSKWGWVHEFVDEKRSGMSLNLSEGLTVFSPGSYKMWNPNNPAHQLFSKLNEARQALARALTLAGLGVGDRPIPNGIIVIDFPPDSDAAKAGNGSKFNPQFDGVYLQVGSRPVGATVAWIKAGRPDMLGNKAADQVPAERPK